MGRLMKASSPITMGSISAASHLWSRAISHLDAVAITHAHADRMGGAAAILANFRPQELWLSDPSDPEMKALLQQAQELGVRVPSARQAMSSTLVGRRCESWLPLRRTWPPGAMMNLW